MSESKKPGQLFSPVKTLEAVRSRLTETVLSKGFNHPALVSEIRRKFGSTDVDAGAIAQQPVIEAAFPYLTGSETLGELAGGLLHAKVVDALSDASPERQYVFPRSLKPYAHQVETWRLLHEETPQSVLVTSGTGSGKTECFLLPLLDDLAREADASGALKGVRAIALYPLNALIASQEERLREWTAPFNGKIRFGLYNGLMPDDAQTGSVPKEQVVDRRTLRSNPPPILVTNITMLEYMTVRKQDRPLIEASTGKLRWIILDEAHSYIGSRAAEVALLIRRVLLAFGVKPTDVRFVATSATIGEGGDVAKKLKAFLRDVAGVPEDRVHVVVGQRSKPLLPPATQGNRLSADDAGDRTKLSQNPVVQSLMRQFDAGPMPWSAFSSIASQTGLDSETLAQALAGNKRVGPTEPLMPMRAHGFIRGIPGIWTCLNPKCPDSAEGWPFGSVLPEQVQRCPHCRSAVLEIERCDECDEPFLTGVERRGRLTLGSGIMDADEFAADSEEEKFAEDDDANEEDANAAPDIVRLISVREHPSSRPLHIEPKTGAVCDAANEDTILVSTHDRTPECPACGARPPRSKGAGAGLLKKFRSGAPLLIGNATPVLLDGVTPRQDRFDSKAPIPFGGRQILSFTDSRQGTARFAASLQNGSERNFLRAAIYHAVQDTVRPEPGSEQKIADIEADIADFEPLAAANPRYVDRVKKLKQERDALLNPIPTGIAWKRLREQLADRPEIDVLMRNVWRFRDERFYNSSPEFTEFLMLRELARRPRRAVALETLGLARLRAPQIDALAENRLPPVFKVKGLTLDDYRHFLQVVLSTTARANFAIRTAKENIHWFSGQRFQRFLNPPNQPGMARITDGEPANRNNNWPRAKGQTIAARLLGRALRLNSTESHDCELIDEVLRQAWTDLLPLFAQPGSGANYALDFEKLNVAPVQTAYFCPVTRRLTDVLFAGLSPQAFGNSSRYSGEPAEAFDMPVHPNPFLLEERGGADVVNAWLRDDLKIETLRSRGLWTNLHDRIALESPYFRAAEHSAQQPPSRLRFYEREFKDGRINILNCSTTMEMGVDIGSVSTVMMTNVPPSIANYKQRIGRAGRRGQGFALSLTYARPSPLDLETFRDPVTYLNRRIEAPKVTLDSKRIVQRHVNALLLAHWFKSAGGEALRTKVGEFFGCSAIIDAKHEKNSPATLFQKWTQTASVVTEMSTAIAILVRGSALEGDPGLVEAAGKAMKEAQAGFVGEWEAVQAQASGMERDVAKKSLGFQLKRMCGENLLGELADRGVLPGHGFPTDVVSFVNKDEPDKDDVDRSNDRDGNRFRRRSYPSRNLDLAIRDYAPGAEVVVDGLVFKSAGVTLNWKRPAGESEVNEIQSLKWFWECSHCGSAGTSILRPDTCPSCNAVIEPKNVMRFLRPAGFTVDMTVKPHAEINEISYVEPEPERVSARGAEWQSFLDEARGRIRASNDGLVYYSSKGGTRGFGYSVCLECGRAEADPPGIGTPGFKPMPDHRPLRFTRADAEGRCPGNSRPFSVQSGLALGHEISTDVVEIQPSGLDSQSAAWALGAAIREALARRLGVESTELGVAVEGRQTPIGGWTHSIFLYDRAAGGAGFAPRLIDLFDDVLLDSRKILTCVQPGCVTCCSACVLASDLATKADLIDRAAALEYLDRDLAGMTRPEVLDEAADGAMLSSDVADELLATTAAKDSVTIWPARGEFDPAGLTSTRMSFLLDKLQRNGARVQLSFAPSAIAALDPSQKLALRDAAIKYNFDIVNGAAPEFRHGSIAIASSSGRKVWSTRDAQAGVMGDEWGLGHEAPVVRFDGATPANSIVALDSLLPAPGTIYVEIGRKLDGPSNTFGDRFIHVLQPELTKAGLWRPGALKAIEYSDRYVSSPMTAMLLIQVSAALTKHLGKNRSVQLRLTTSPLRNTYDRQDRPQYLINHDWREETRRAEVLKLFAGRFEWL